MSWNERLEKLTDRTVMPVLRKVASNMGLPLGCFCPDCTTFWGKFFNGNAITCRMCEWKKDNPAAYERIKDDRKKQRLIVQKLLDEVIKDIPKPKGDMPL